ncbi:hypothetical protein D0869_00580 [Hortaea werneckii]|uniref:Uncharacterized protein n=1 Tax=Hortaea werneckii TaxID=91943 RepID=A0A3M6XG96_HORWE|nr:hypothetical protein KC316_g5416 [Hortaea werneckii]RMX89807.1 hypothetical protein D0869_00580 [Hortaea werneckii]
MRSLLSQLLAVGPELAAFILTTPLLSSQGAFAQDQNTVPSPNLNLNDLGRVAIGGDFDSISLYTYEGQSEEAFNSNGSQSLLTRYPNGDFQSLNMADAYITTMCPYVQQDGSLAGVVVGGNFTSLGGVEAQGIALWNPNTTEITALPGLSGKVNAVYCNDESGTVYVGGSFMGANSTNALAWKSGWNNLPFAGFNGPVTSIAKNEAGRIVFGGNFDGLGNTTTPEVSDGQVINLSSGNISAEGSTDQDGFSDPRNIICKTAAQSGEGDTWLLQDNTGGYWQGEFAFGFNPTKLRLYNTQQENRGTKTWYFENMNSGGILNMNYLSAEGRNESCSLNCPLPNDNSTYQDFNFEPPVGMNAFRIHITDWYGEGGGLDGIELFQDDMYSFAIDEFNEPRCDSVSNGSSSVASPSYLWDRVSSSGETSSDYLSAFLNDTSNVGPNTSVIFRPNIVQSGNYSVTVYTPGCLIDDSCDTRGVVNITGSMTTDEAPITTTVYQTNNYDKFDQVYYGYVDIDTDTFEPAVTLSPVPGQGVPLTVVAQRVRFELLTTTGGLNGLFEYNPNEATVDTDFSNSDIDSAGMSLKSDAQVNALATVGDTLYVAGNFSGDGISNVMSVSDENATALPGGGLNDHVQTMFQNGSTLYMGGNFTDTANGGVDGLNGIASFDTDSSEWSALGNGVNGPVYNLVPLPVNVTMESLETCLTVNGDFTSVNSFDGNDAFDAAGFAIWVPSRRNWLNNIPESHVAIRGQLTTYTEVPDSSTLYAGQISSMAMAYSDAVALRGSGQPSLQSLGVQLRASSSSSSSMRKRALSSSRNFTGVYDGYFYEDNGLNITILGGSFEATATYGSTIEDLIFINNTDSSQVVTGLSGLDSGSTFAAMDVYQTSLFAGGAISGSVNGGNVGGVIRYDLATGAYANTQPAALDGDNVIVNSIAVQPDSAFVYVGGSFSAAGSLPCATLCYYDADTSQWNTPASGLTGTITSMVWSSDNQLIIAGNLTVGGNSTTMVTYDAKQQTYQEYTGASGLPGPISAMTPANSDYNQFWAAGTATNNGSTYLAKYKNDEWTSVSGLGDNSMIRGLQVIGVTSNHDSSALMPNDEVLLITGSINVPSTGNASAVLFNGTAYTPFILTSRQDGSQGSISSIFVSRQGELMSGSGGHLALGFVVLIGLAIALGCVFAIVITGILLERLRRKREGYVPMSMDRNANLQRIPPESLLGGLGEKDSAPKI